MWGVCVAWDVHHLLATLNKAAYVTDTHSTGEGEECPSDSNEEKFPRRVLQM